MARNVSLELWLGIGVKHVVFLELWLGIGVQHVVFLELWLRITSLELWLEMADESLFSSIPLAFMYPLDS